MSYCRRFRASVCCSLGTGLWLKSTSSELCSGLCIAVCSVEDQGDSRHINQVFMWFTRTVARQERTSRVDRPFLTKTVTSKSQGGCQQIRSGGRSTTKLNSSGPELGHSKAGDDQRKGERACKGGSPASAARRGPDFEASVRSRPARPGHRGVATASGVCLCVCVLCRVVFCEMFCPVLGRGTTVRAEAGINMKQRPIDHKRALKAHKLHKHYPIVWR